MISIKETFEDIKIETDNKLFSKFPLSRYYADVLIKDIDITYANAIMRASTFESNGYALDIERENIKTNDTAILNDHLVQTINHIPLLFPLTDKEIDNISLYIDYTNNSKEYRMIYSGDLKFNKDSPINIIFNPNIQLCKLQPGARISLKDICIIRGNASVESRFNKAIRPGLVYENKTHLKNSSTVKDIHIQFDITSTLKGTKNIAKNIISEGISNILRSLEKITKMIMDDESGVIISEDKIQVKPNMTNTIYEMLKRKLSYNKKIYNVGKYELLGDGVELFVCSDDPVKDLLNAIEELNIYLRKLDKEL